MEITVRVEAGELANAINNLAMAMRGIKGGTIPPVQQELNFGYADTNLVPAELAQAVVDQQAQSAPATLPAAGVPAPPIQAPTVQAPPVQTTPIAPPVQNTPPVQTPPAAPPAQTMPAAGVPTAPPVFTQEQISRAGGELLDMGKREELCSMLKTKYGVDAIVTLPKEAYGALATDLRAMGARI